MHYRGFLPIAVGLLAVAPFSAAIQSAPVKTDPAAGDEAIAKRYAPASAACTKAMSAAQDAKESVGVCVRAAQIAAEFAPGRRFVEKRSAFVSAAKVLAGSGDLKSALPWAAKAVRVVKLGHDDYAGGNDAYSAKGTIEAMMGDLQHADGDLAAAEDSERKGILWADKEAPNLVGEYERVLARNLHFHALVLQRLNRADDAQKLLDEAAKYK